MRIFYNLLKLERDNNFNLLFEETYWLLASKQVLKLNPNLFSILRFILGMYKPELQNV